MLLHTILARLMAVVPARAFRLRRPCTFRADIFFSCFFVRLHSGENRWCLTRSTCGDSAGRQVPQKRAEGAGTRKRASVANPSTAKKAWEQKEEKERLDRRRKCGQIARAVAPGGKHQRHRRTGIPAAGAISTATPTVTPQTPITAARARKRPVAGVSEASSREVWAEWNISRSSGTRASRAGSTRNEAEATGVVRVGAQERRREVVSERLQVARRMARREEGVGGARGAGVRG